MKVAVKYLAQLKQAVGVPSETVEIDAPCTLRQLMHHLAERHGEPFRRLVLAPNGLQRTLLFFVGEEQVRWDSPAELRDGDVVTVMSPIAGGGEAWPSADR